MVGLVAFDFVLRFVLARVVDVSFVIDVLCMHLDDSPADPSGLRVPAYMVMQLESFFHTSSFDDFGRATSYSPAENSPGCRRSIEVFRRMVSDPYATGTPRPARFSRDRQAWSSQRLRGQCQHKITFQPY